MPVFGPANAQCHVFTQKEGLLSAIAHDLEIEVTDFSIDATNAAIRVLCNPNSLRVLYAMKDGKPFDALSEKDKREIQENIVKDVLESSRFPEIAFVSTNVARTSEGGHVEGVLTMHGISRPLRAAARAERGSYVVDVPIHLPDYGIKPYTAMLGTLKVKADLVVRVTVPHW